MIMNTERELRLSALLDDHLSPDERRSVETAVASDPAAAETLRSLAGVRDLVAGLSRPAGPDLAPAVLERLKTRASRRAGRRPTIRPLRLATLAAGVAASLACLALFGGRFQGPQRPAQQVAPAPPEVLIADASPKSKVDADAANPTAAAELVGPPAPVEPVAATGDAPAVAIASAEPPIAETPAIDPDRLLVRELLDGRRSPRIFLVMDQEGESTADRVASLVGLSTHRDFHRVELPDAAAEGEADGAGASRATVFAATLNPDELATLQERLATAFPERFEEEGERPEIAGDLMDQGRVATLAPNPAADVRIPPTNLAIRFRPREGRNWPTTEPSDEPTAEPEPTRPSLEASSIDAETSRQPRLIQIWIVTSPDK